MAHMLLDCVESPVSDKSQFPSATDFALCRDTRLRLRLGILPLALLAALAQLSGQALHCVSGQPQR